jgi:hypothetical protein
MAMRRSGTGSGGGYKMNKHVHSRAPKAEPRPRAINPSAVNQLGNMLGDHTTHSKTSTGYRGEDLVRGKGYSGPIGPTDNVAACGVGGGRDVHKTGSQGLTGSGGAPKPAGRDILSEYGPESKR